MLTHQKLPCGVELAVLQLPERRAEAIQIRLLAGAAHDPVDKLGLAHLVEATLDKGTHRRDGRALNDAFDAIGAGVHSSCGRETTALSSLCLPEYFNEDLALLVEMIREPSFPEESCEIAVELARQELLTLEDDAQALADKLIGRRAYGPMLGRYVGGEKETLEAITRQDFLDFWASGYRAPRIILAAAGPLAAEPIAERVQALFEGFGDPGEAGAATFEIAFTAGALHHDKTTEQQHIAMACPSVARRHADYPAERMLVGVLAGGMSARLFTEVREKLGLVYWVGAWGEHPRDAGMLFFGASTTPERCHETYETMLREIRRVGEDVTAEELRRVLAGIEVRSDIRGDITRMRAVELADDIIHHGRPLSDDERLSRLRAVTVEDVKDYCRRYVSADHLSVVTLGPRALDLAAHGGVTGS